MICTRCVGRCVSRRRTFFGGSILPALSGSLALSAAEWVERVNRAYPIRVIRSLPAVAGNPRFYFQINRIACNPTGKQLSFLLMAKSYHSDPKILGGEPVFIGTRVPIQSLFDHLEAGESIDDFLKGFPSVKREQVISLLKESHEKILEPA